MLLTCHALAAVRWAPLPKTALASRRAEIMVCRVSIAENQHQIPLLHRLLTPAEQQRASRYHDEADYYRFVVRRAALRLLLGACLGQPPADVQFVPGPNKKPLLPTAQHLHYNVSHSGNWVLLVIAPVEVGVDIEYIAPDFPAQQLLAHGFSQAEQAFIRQHAAPAPAFFQLWTRKEALVKATAQGIDADFSQVPALDGRHQWPAQHPSPIAEWTVSSFLPADDYAAALAYPTAVPASQVQFYEVGDLLRWTSQ